ncbi:hypothetical protein HMPREF0378_1731 [Eubacterium nodatum ATCC 33099]|nr:hypothetical protein HMPREF0378_1731 [Eubacterium nodatum ATCC 33099]
MEYKALNLDTHKKEVKIGTVIVGLLLVFLGTGLTGYIKFNIVAVIFGTLLVLSALLRKTVTVSSDGLLVHYDMRIAKHQELWGWKDMFSLTWQKDENTPDLWRIYFTKDDRTRKFLFTEDDMENILKLGKEKNPSIKIYEAVQRNK